MFLLTESVYRFVMEGSAARSGKRPLARSGCKSLRNLLVVM